MTLIAALEAQDGLVLGSDSRGTVGDPRGLTAINDVHKKLFQLSECCGIAASGSAELNNLIIDLFTKHLNEKSLVDVDSIVNEFFLWARPQYQKWFGSRPFIVNKPILDQRPSMVFIIAGYNKNTDLKARIYLLHSNLDFAPQLCTSGHMLAGIPQYAIYLIHRLYNPQMKLINIKNLTAYLIQETATQDPKVGGPIRMAQITLESGYQELSESTIKEIIKKNEEQSIKLRGFFFEGVDNNDQKNR